MGKITRSEYESLMLAGEGDMPEGDYSEIKKFAFQLISPNGCRFGDYVHF